MGLAHHDAAANEAQDLTFPGVEIILKKILGRIGETVDKSPLPIQENGLNEKGRNGYGQNFITVALGIIFDEFAAFGFVLPIPIVQQSGCGVNCAIGVYFQ